MFVARQWTIGSPLPHLLVPGSGRHRGSVLGGALSVVRVQCARSATIWASGRNRNPYFVVLWASLLFGSRF